MGLKDTVTAKYMRQNEIFADAFNYFVYDALQYTKQVERAITAHKEFEDYRGVNGDEYLSGFMKGDHLMPVLTLVVYFGVKAWDGPLSVHEMFEEQDSRVLSLVPDYKVNLIAPAMMEDGEFDKFQTTLKEVLSFIKYSKDKEKLAELMAHDEEFKHLGRNEVDVLNTCVGANLTMDEEEEECNVCKAFQDYAKEAAENAAIQERSNTLLYAAKNLMKNMGLTAEQSMDAMGVPEGEREMLVSQL